MNYSESIKTLEKDFFQDHQISLPCPAHFGRGKRTQILGLCLLALVTAALCPQLSVCCQMQPPLTFTPGFVWGVDGRGKSTMEGHCLPCYHRNATENGTDVLFKIIPTSAHPFDSSLNFG